MGRGELPEPRRYLSHDRPEEGDVELMVQFGGNGDLYVSIVPKGHKLARIAITGDTGWEAGPDACVRVTTSGERRGHHHVAGAVRNLWRAMGGEPPETSSTSTTADRDRWTAGFALALVEMHRQLIADKEDAALCRVASAAGLTLAEARRVGLDARGVEQLRKAGVR